MPGYQVKQECIAVQGVADLQIRSLLDHRQFADPLGEASALGISSAQWPLFGLLWPSGLHLASAMGRRPLQSGERILELGCGLGLASLVSHRRGAEVTASDCHPLADAFLRENLRLNGLLPMKYRHGPWLDDGAEPAEGDVQGRFDLIIGSDVLYERDEAGLLPQFIARHAADAGEVLIVDPNRGNRSAFHRAMTLLGYTRDETVLLGEAADGSAYRGRLLRFQRAAAGRDLLSEANFAGRPD